MAIEGNGIVQLRNVVMLALAVISLVTVINAIAFRLLDIETNADTETLEIRLRERIDSIHARHMAEARFTLCRIGTYDISADSLACEAYILGTEWEPFIERFRSRRR